MASYVELREEGDLPVESRERASRSRLIVGSIAVGLVCVVGVIIGTTWNHSDGTVKGNGDSQQSSGSAPQAATMMAVPDEYSAHFPAKSVRPEFAVHPLLSTLQQEGEDHPTDPTIKTYSSHYHVETPNHFTHFDAEVEAVKDTVVISHHHAAQAIACPNVTKLLVRFSDEIAARNFSQILTANTLLPLEEEWNCTYGAQILRATGAASVHGAIVAIPTINASVSDLFKNANISYNGTGFGTPVYPNSKPVDLNLESDRSRRGFGNWLHRAWHHITHTAKTVVHDVGGVGKVVEGAVHLAVTGDTDVDKKLYNTDFTMGPAPCFKGHPATQTGREIRDLSQCQFHAGLALVFQLQVSHYHLELASLYAEGDMHGDISTNGQALDHTWSGSSSLKIFDSTIFSISIPVCGVPLPLKLTGSMYTHPDWSITGELTVNSDIRTSGTLKWGAMYTKSHGMQPVRTDTLYGTGDLNSVTGTFTFDGSMEMDAVFQLDALYVATANVDVTITPTFRAVATETIMGPGGESVSVDGTNVTTHRIAAQAPGAVQPCHPTRNAHNPVDNPSFEFNAGASVSVTAGAALDVKLPIWHRTIYDHTFNFGSLFSHEWTFGPWCKHVHV